VLALEADERRLVLLLLEHRRRGVPDLIGVLVAQLAQDRVGGPVDVAALGVHRILARLDPLLALGLRDLELGRQLDRDAEQLPPPLIVVQAHRHAAQRLGVARDQRHPADPARGPGGDQRVVDRGDLEELADRAVEVGHVVDELLLAHHLLEPRRRLLVDQADRAPAELDQDLLGVGPEVRRVVAVQLERDDHRDPAGDQDEPDDHAADEEPAAPGARDLGQPVQRVADVGDALAELGDAGPHHRHAARQIAQLGHALAELGDAAADRPDPAADPRHPGVDRVLGRAGEPLAARLRVARPARRDRLAVARIERHRHRARLAAVRIGPGSTSGAIGRIGAIGHDLS
jgi:hypothetical protein